MKKNKLNRHAKLAQESNRYQKGFTLIELLVVVLTIGILAAVALPQYQIAVEKSRATEALTLNQTIAHMNKAYFMANGQYTANIHELDIEIHGNDARNNTCKENTLFLYCAKAINSAGETIALANRLPVGTWYSFEYFEDDTQCCYGYNRQGIKICQALSNNTIDSNYKVQSFNCYQIK